MIVGLPFTICERQSNIEALTVVMRCQSRRDVFAIFAIFA